MGLRLEGRGRRWLRSPSLLEPSSFETRCETASLLRMRGWGCVAQYVAAHLTSPPRIPPLSVIPDMTRDLGALPPRRDPGSALRSGRDDGEGGTRAVTPCSTPSCSTPHPEERALLGLRLEGRGLAGLDLPACWNPRPSRRDAKPHRSSGGGVGCSIWQSIPTTPHIPPPSRVRGLAGCVLRTPNGRAARNGGLRVPQPAGRGMRDDLCFDWRALKPAVPRTVLEACFAGSRGADTHPVWFR